MLGQKGHHNSSQNDFGHLLQEDKFNFFHTISFRSMYIGSIEYHSMWNGDSDFIYLSIFFIKFHLTSVYK